MNPYASGLGENESISAGLSACDSPIFLGNDGWQDSAFAKNVLNLFHSVQHQNALPTEDHTKGFLDSIWSKET